MPQCNVETTGSPRTKASLRTFGVDSWSPSAAAAERLSGELDRMEKQGDAFHGRVRDGFLAESVKRPDMITVIDAAGSIEQVQKAIQEAVESKQ